MKLLRLFIFICMLSSCQREGRLPDMTETYGYQETKPFGGSIMYELSSATFSGDHEVTHTTFHRLYLANDDSGAVFISLASETDLSQNDVQSLIGFTSQGNTAIIISDRIDSLLLKEIGIKQVSKGAYRGYGNGFVSLNEEIDVSRRVYGFYHKPLSNYFIVDDSIVKVLGYNSSYQPDALLVSQGDGNILLFANSRSFSNFFFLSGSNYVYLQRIFQSISIHSSKWYWDNYYPQLKRDKNSGGSTLAEIMRYPPLAAAFLLAIALLLIYILFQGKRRREVIPVPEDKTSPASFMETISELYIHEAENRLIAHKIINRFQDYIGRKWFFHNLSELPAAKLSFKTGVPEENVIELYTLIDKSGYENISNEELIRLEHLTQMFYKI